MDGGGNDAERKKLGPCCLRGTQSAYPLTIGTFLSPNGPAYHQHTDEHCFHFILPPDSDDHHHHHHHQQTPPPSSSCFDRPWFLADERRHKTTTHHLQCSIAALILRDRGYRLMDYAKKSWKAPVPRIEGRETRNRRSGKIISKPILAIAVCFNYPTSATAMYS